MTPSVYNYLNYRRFLKDWYDAKKASNHRFSHRAFVRRTGQRSPSLLRDVMTGRRNLTPKTVEAFCRALSLDLGESAFFSALVELDQARTLEGKNEAWKRIAQTKRFQEARKLEEGDLYVLSHWYYPAIRELVARPDFQDDPAWIARTLVPQIKPREAREALQFLLEHGFLVREGGRLAARDMTVVTAGEVADLSVRNYHFCMSELTVNAVNAFDSDERHFCALTAGVPESLLPELKKELEQMKQRLLHLCEGTAGPVDQVIQVNLNFYPLSTPRSS